jgi:hypothetical protein
MRDAFDLLYREGKTIPLSAERDVGRVAIEPLRRLL